MPLVNSESTHVVEVEVEVEIWCEKCGAGLCNTVSIIGNQIKVPPCEDCMSKEKEAGYDDGYDEGNNNGYEEAMADHVDQTDD